MNTYSIIIIRDDYMRCDESFVGESKEEAIDGFLRSLVTYSLKRIMHCYILFGEDQRQSFVHQKDDEIRRRQLYEDHCFAIKKFALQLANMERSDPKFDWASKELFACINATENK